MIILGTKGLWRYWFKTGWKRGPQNSVVWLQDFWVHCSSRCSLVCLWNHSQGVREGVIVEVGLGTFFSMSSAWIQIAHRCRCQLLDLPGCVVRPAGSLLLCIPCSSRVSLELLELTAPTVLATGCWEGCWVDSSDHLPCYGLVSCGFSWKLTVMCHDVFVRKWFQSSKWRIEKGTFRAYLVSYVNSLKFSILYWSYLPIIP